MKNLTIPLTLLFLIIAQSIFSTDITWTDKVANDPVTVADYAEIKAAVNSKSNHAGDIYTGTHDFGGAVLEIPNSDADPAALGQVRVDTAVSGAAEGVIRWYDGTSIRHVIDITDTAFAACTDDQVLAYDTAADVFYCKDDGGGAGGVGDSSDTELTFNNSGTLDGLSAWTVAANVITMGSGASLAGLDTLDLSAIGKYQVGSVNINVVDNVWPCEFCIAISDEDTDLTVADDKRTFRMPYAMTLTAGRDGVRASVKTAPTDATIIIDIEEGGTTILSTLLTIDATEKTSYTAVAPVVISDTALADDAEITINIDQVGSSVIGTGAKVCFMGTRDY